MNKGGSTFGGASQPVMLVAARRTPFGRAHPDQGWLKDIRADELLAGLIANVVTELPDKAAIDDVLIGCVGQHLEQGKNIARLALLLAKLPESVPGVTFNRLCASSLEAFNTAAVRIAAGSDELLLAGGVEHMHHVPMTAAIDYHPKLARRGEFPFMNMGLATEWLAGRDGISRADQDAWALASHQRAVAATAQGDYAAEIAPVDISAESGGPARIDRDQGPRANTSLKALAELKPAFDAHGTVTAGNASALSDGASLTVLAAPDACKRHGLKPMAEVLGHATIAIEPQAMARGPVPAIERLLERCGLVKSDIDRFEINEAFAAQIVSNIRQLGLDAERVNPSGGAIALGHPLGATGTRLITTLAHGLARDDGEFGIAALCVGHGQGVATLIRRMQS